MHSARTVRERTCILLLALALPSIAAAQVAEVQVTPARLTLEVGKRTALYAAGYDRQGNLVPGTDFVFASSDTAVALVSTTGSVIGVGPGSAVIEARAGSRRATASVTVSGPAEDAAAGIASISIEPAMVALLPLEPARLSVRAIRRDGTSGNAGAIAWRSLDPKIAQVDGLGLVVGIAPGRTMVQATAGGITASIPVAVDTAVFTTPERRALAPGAVDTLYASVPAQGGRRLAAGLTWRSADPAVVRVGPAGDVVAAGAGETEVIVSGYGMTGRIRIVVRKPVAAFTLVPRASSGPVVVPLGTARRFEARGEAADSTPIPDLPLNWELADTAIAQFTPGTGMLEARRAGTTTLTARLEGFQPIVWTISVVPTRIVLDQRRLGLRIGGRVTLTPGLAEMGGAAIVAAAPALTWTSDRPTVATVQGGVIEASAPGRALITATAPWGASAAAEVFVTGDLLVASDRGGSFGIYHVQLGITPGFTPLVTEATNIHPAFSPDRTRIAFSSTRAGSYDLYVMDADGRNARRITVDAGTEGDPVWTPDGTHLLYTGAPRAGVPQIMSIRADGGDPHPVTASTGGNRRPDVSPDGKRVVFVSTRDGDPELYESAIDGGEARRLTKSGDRKNSPRYLPNGDILYVLEKGSKARLMRITPGAKDPVPVLEVDQPVIVLDVSRDGERVAYIAGKLSEAGKGKSQLTLRIQPLGVVTPPLLVPLRPGEQVLSPSF